MAKRTQRLSKTKARALKIEALEQRQLLAGSFSSREPKQRTVSVVITDDPVPGMKVKFLDLCGQVVEAEVSSASHTVTASDQDLFTLEKVPLIEAPNEPWRRGRPLR